MSTIKVSMRLMLKEWRELLPLVALFVVLLLLGYVMLPVFARIDEEYFSRLCQGACDPGLDIWYASVYLILIMAVAYSLFPRDHSSGALQFVRQLPVSFAQIYWAKWLAALLLVVSFDAVSYLLFNLVLGTHTDSVSSGFYLQVQWRLVLMSAIFVAVSLSYGLLLSAFGLGGLMLLACYLVGITWFEHATQSASPLHLFELMRNRFEGEHLLLPVDAMMIHLPLALVACYAGYRIWHRKAMLTTDPVRSATRVRVLACLVLLIPGIIAAVLLAPVWFGQAGAPNTMERVEDGRLSWTLKASDRQRLQMLFDTAESDFERVSEHLQLQLIPPVTVDATRGSGHFAGSAGWQRVRFDPATRTEQQRFVLAHEFVHVLQHDISQRQAGAAMPKVLIEGMADFLAYEALSMDIATMQRRWQQRLLAALAQQRQNITAALLFDTTEFEQRFAPEYLYSLGELWMQALEDECGATAPRQLLDLVGDSAQRARLAAVTNNWQRWFYLATEIQCNPAEVEQRWQLLLQSVRAAATLAAAEPTAADGGGVDAAAVDSAQSQAADAELVANTSLLEKLPLPLLVLSADPIAALAPDRSPVSGVFTILFDVVDAGGAGAGNAADPSAGSRFMSYAYSLRVREFRDDDIERIWSIRGVAVRNDSGQVQVRFSSGNFPAGGVSVQPVMRAGHSSQAYFQRWQRLRIPRSSD